MQWYGFGFTIWNREKVLWLNQTIRKRTDKKLWFLFLICQVFWNMTADTALKKLKIKIVSINTSWAFWHTSNTLIFYLQGVITSNTEWNRARRSKAVRVRSRLLLPTVIFPIPTNKKRWKLLVSLTWLVERKKIFIYDHKIDIRDKSTWLGSTQPGQHAFWLVISQTFEKLQAYNFCPIRTWFL